MDVVSRCPSCGARDTRRSRTRGILDAIMSAFDRKPMRCRQCQRRFYVYVQPEEEGDARDEESHPAEHRQESKVD
jgi:hypothetical protein